MLWLKLVNVKGPQMTYSLLKYHHVHLNELTLIDDANWKKKKKKLNKKQKQKKTTNDSPLIFWKLQW